MRGVVGALPLTSSLGGRECLFAELNSLGWLTVVRDSRVDGW